MPTEEPDVTEDVRDGPPPPLDGFAPLAGLGGDGLRRRTHRRLGPGRARGARGRRHAGAGRRRRPRVRGARSRVARAAWRRRRHPPDLAGRRWPGRSRHATSRTATRSTPPCPPDRRRVTQEEVADGDPAPGLGPRGPARDGGPPGRVRGRPRAAARGPGARRAHGRVRAPARRRLRGLARRPAARRGQVRRAAGRGPGTGRAGGLARVGDRASARRSGWPTAERRRRTGTARRGRWPRSCGACRRTGSTISGSSSAASTRADGTAERVIVVMDRRPPAAEVVGLLRSVGWDLRASEPASLERALNGTTEFATAWDGERLIGTARSITDGGQNALIATVVVHPSYHGLGVGERDDAPAHRRAGPGAVLARGGTGPRVLVPQAGVPARPPRDVPAAPPPLKRRRE